METFFSLLDRHVQTQNTLLCVGLDPHPGDLPAATAEAALDNCLRLVRESIENLSIGDMQPGEVRELTKTQFYTGLLL